jgi:uncharacterized RDD family membrane protein YckC
MEECFYISNGGEALGPYEISQLCSMWNAGQITANFLYWKEDSQEWRGIDELRLGETQTTSAPKKTDSTTPTTLSSDERHDLHKRRSNAFVIDLLVGLCVFAALLYIGSLSGASDMGFVALTTMGFLYFLFADSLPRGQSVGKRTFGIQTVQLRPFRPCSPLRSLARNSILWSLILGPLLVGSALAAILKAAGVGGIILGLISVGILAVLFSQHNRTTTNLYGQTLADQWSGTQVIRFRE